jgi:two-component system NarL family sensor kinase
VLAGLDLLRHSGLVAALERLAGGHARDGLQVEVRAEGYPALSGESADRLDLAGEEALYRIAQEALNNIAKHARARRIEIRLENAGDSVQLVIQDDGIGFALEQVGAPGKDSRLHGGLGLKTMRERAEAQGGRLQTISAPGHGTTLKVKIPLSS